MPASSMFWPAVPEDIKNEIRQTIIFLQRRHDAARSGRGGADYVAQRMRIAEANAAREARAA